MSYGLVNGATINGTPAAGSSLDQTHAVSSIQSTSFGSEVATAHRVVSIRSTSFGAATATSSATAYVASIRSTSFGMARAACIASLDEALESTQFGGATCMEINAPVEVPSIQSMQFGQALHTSIAAANPIQSTKFSQALHICIATVPGIESTTFGAPSLTAIHSLLPSMAGTIFGRPTAHRGITC